MDSIPHQSREQNEAIADALSGEVIASVRYYPLYLDDQQELWQWDFGPWHEPTMGVELITEKAEPFSLIWNQHDEWGFEVSLYDRPMTDHLIPDASISQVEVSGHPLWLPVIGRPIEVSIHFNDYGTGRPPSAEMVRLTTDTGSAWIITGRSERQQSKLSFQLGLDDIMVVFDEKFIEALGLFDSQRGRVDT